MPINRFLNEITGEEEDVFFKHKDTPKLGVKITYNGSVLTKIRKLIPARKRINEFIESAVEDFINGMTIVDITTKYKTSQQAISKELKDRGLDIRKGYSWYSSNDQTFREINDEKSAYFLGLLYADGNVGEKNNIVLILAQEDRYLVEALKEYAQYTGPVHFQKRYKEHYADISRLYFCNKKICENLAKLGCVPRKSLILKFPTFDQVPEYLMNHFIRGYFDGDGSAWVCKRGKIFSELVGTYDFCSKTADFLKKKLNITCNVYDQKNTTVKRLKISTRASYVFLDYLYKDCSIKMERKFVIFKKCISEHKTLKNAGGLTTEEQLLKIKDYYAKL